MGLRTRVRAADRMGTMHTPGPWVVDDDAVDLQQRMTIVVGFPNGILGTLRGYRDANARLIAAAPELLAACETALAAANAVHWPELAVQLSNAIAKARGGA